jgi:pimeloyl-ACP methyl ester carboxylesterase
LCSSSLACCWDSSARDLGCVAHGAIAAAASVVAGVLCFGALYLLLLRPPARTTPVLVAGPEVRYWQLPTGSRIAYVKSTAVGQRRPEPVIFLHGGPGIPVLPTFAVLGERPALDTLTALGHDVDYYDQLGCGYSSRLDLRTGVNYTIARYVADLDAIRAAIGAEQVVLVGVSMGAVLASRYMLEHPDRVAKVVFVSPGSIAPDPRPRLRGNTTPALVLRGECDYIAWPVAREYRRAASHRRLCRRGLTLVRAASSRHSRQDRGRTPDCRGAAAGARLSMV